MCHHVYVRLSAEERKAVTKLSGVLIPAYALALLAMFAFAALSHQPRSGETLTAAAEMPAAKR
jgi:hypothetical protein